MGFAPGDDLGIVVLTNGASKDKGIEKLVKHIMEEASGLDAKGWEFASSESTTKKVGPNFNQTHRSQDVSAPTLPIEQYAGKYTSPGYVNITLCAPTSTSPECLEVLKDFFLFDDVASPENRYTLYAAFPTLWSTHLRLHHVGGDDFEMLYTDLFPEGYGKDLTPFELWEKDDHGAPIKFEVEENPENGERRVVALGIMGTPEEQEGRRRLMRPAGPNPSISLLAEVLATRVGSA